MTEQTMIERVARALHKSIYDNGGIEEDDGWDSCPPAMRDDRRRSARAILTAMREPTDVMDSAASDRTKMGYDPACFEVWRAMIDAALAEGK